MISRNLKSLVTNSDWIIDDGLQAAILGVWSQLQQISRRMFVPWTARACLEPIMALSREGPDLNLQPSSMQESKFARPRSIKAYTKVINVRSILDERTSTSISNIKGLTGSQTQWQAYCMFNVLLLVGVRPAEKSHLWAYLRSPWQHHTMLVCACS